MSNVLVYYGPKSGFYKFISNYIVDDEDKISLSELVRMDDEQSRIYRVETSESPNINGLSLIEINHLCSSSDEYSSVREHVLLNFESFIRRFRINNIYLHNPPQLVFDKIKKSYGILKIENHAYPKITKEVIRSIYFQYDKVIIGQNLAMRKILASLVRMTKNNSKPIVILLYGPSGVGKTETAKLIAKNLSTELFRKQLSMFQNNEFVSYFFGGHHYENSFAKELLERENNIILLDEFDKANPIFYSAFYQLFDEGVFVDKNYKVEIGNPLIICTSNYTSIDEIRKHLGDPIFSRIDSCIEFNNFDDINIEIIIKKIFEEELQNLSDEDKDIISDRNILSNLIKYKHRFQNARYIAKIVKETISLALLDKIIESEIK